jgi:hypothetical protein
VVAYFYEHMGILVSYKLVPEDIVIDMSANALVRSWYALEPFIRQERIHRKGNASAGISPNFVSHFEHLAAIATKVHNGKYIDDPIHERLKLKKITP